VASPRFETVKHGLQPERNSGGSAVVHEEAIFIPEQLEKQDT
jgi:hypothetical protein